MSNARKRQDNDELSSLFFCSRGRTLALGCRSGKIAIYDRKERKFVSNLQVLLLLFMLNFRRLIQLLKCRCRDTHAQSSQSQRTRTRQGCARSTIPGNSSFIVYQRARGRTFRWPASCSFRLPSTRSAGAPWLRVGTTGTSISGTSTRRQCQLLHLRATVDLSSAHLPNSPITDKDSHTLCCRALSWCPTNKNYIVSVSLDKTVRLWSTSDRKYV